MGAGNRAFQIALQTGRLLGQFLEDLSIQLDTELREQDARMDAIEARLDTLESPE